MREEITVSIPARAEFLHIVRSVAAAVAARLDSPYDTIEDLRMAVDEACAQLLAIGPPASNITVRMALSSEGIEVTVFTDGETEEWPPPKADQSFGWRTLSVLTDEAMFERADAGSPAVKLRKRVRTG